MHRIRIKNGPHILRWGYSSKGVFNIKEAYGLKAYFHLLSKENIWHNIWQANLWHKFSSFLWLVAHGRILTWDNIWKRGFIVPSVCPIFLQHEETMEHLLN
jgi:hypothetical protein